MADHHAADSPPTEKSAAANVEAPTTGETTSAANTMGATVTANSDRPRGEASGASARGAEQPVQPSKSEDHVILPIDVSPNKTAPITIRDEDYVDAGEGYHAWYPPAPYRAYLARDAETEDYIHHGSDPDYEARALGFDEDPVRSHMRRMELSKRITDEELERELQYDLHCQEEYERNARDCATISEVYPLAARREHVVVRRLLRSRLPLLLANKQR